MLDSLIKLKKKISWSTNEDIFFQTKLKILKQIVCQISIKEFMGILSEDTIRSMERHYDTNPEVTERNNFKVISVCKTI